MNALKLITLIFISMFLASCGQHDGENNSNSNSNIPEDMSSSDDMKNNQSIDMAGHNSGSNQSNSDCSIDEDCTNASNYKPNPDQVYCISLDTDPNGFSFCSECRSDDDCTGEKRFCNRRSGVCSEN